MTELEKKVALAEEVRRCLYKAVVSGFDSGEDYHWMHFDHDRKADLLRDILRGMGRDHWSDPLWVRVTDLAPYGHYNWHNELRAFSLVIEKYYEKLEEEQ